MSMPYLSIGIQVCQQLMCSLPKPTLHKVPKRRSKLLTMRNLLRFVLFSLRVMQQTQLPELRRRLHPMQTLPKRLLSQYRNMLPVSNGMRPLPIKHEMHAMCKWILPTDKWQMQTKPIKLHLSGPQILS